MANWGNNFGARVLVVVVGWIVLGIIISNNSSSNSATNVADSVTPSVIENSVNSDTEATALQVSAEKLAQDYANNEINADWMYKDKVLEVNWEIYFIGTTAGQPIIQILAGVAGVIQCNLTNQDASLLVNLNKGDNIVVYGILDRTFWIALTNCEIK